MFEIIERKTQSVSPKQAAKWLALNTFMSQRNLRPQHVGRLSSAIVSGNFTTGNIAFAKNKSGTRIELMNGQHQLHAIIQTGKSIVAHIETAVCATEIDASQYFSQFDVGAVRSIGDIVKAEADSHGITWNKRISSLLVAAIEYISTKNTYRSPDQSVTKFDRAGNIKRNIPEGDFLNNTFTGENGKMLIRVPVAVAAIMSFHVDPAAAVYFWEGVKTGINLGEKDPRRPLRDFLMATPISASRNRSRGAATPREITVRCIHAWNAWRRNDERIMLSKYSPETDFPKVA